MKKEVKRLGISTTGLVLMVMVAFGSLFSSCYTKDDIPVVPEVKPLENSYVITGDVWGYDYDTDNYGPLSGVTITCSPAATKFEQTNEAYALYVNAPATYTLTFSKAGYESVTATVIVPEATEKTGQLVVVPYSLTLYKEYTAPTPSTTGNITVADGGSISDNGSALWFYPNSVFVDTQISMKAFLNILPAMGLYTDGAQFALGTFGPSGMSFKEAMWSVPSPLTNHYMANLKLQYKSTDIAAGVWKDVENNIFFDKDKDHYYTMLTHFSQYRMVYMPESMDWDICREENISMKNIVNTGDKAVMSVDSIEVTKWVGATLTPKNFQWEDYDANLKELIEAAVRARLEITAMSFDGIKEKPEKVALEESVDVPFDYHLVGSGKQYFETAEFCFKIYEKATDKEVDLHVIVEYPCYWSLNYRVEYCGAHHHTNHQTQDYCDAHHHHGHGNNGGAGGGMVEGN